MNEEIGNKERIDGVGEREGEIKGERAREERWGKCRKKKRLRESEEIVLQQESYEH